MRYAHLAALLLAALTACDAAEDGPMAPPIPEAPAECVALPALHAQVDFTLGDTTRPSDCGVGCDGPGEDRFYHFVAPEAGTWRFSVDESAALRILDACDVQAIDPLSTLFDDDAIKDVELDLDAGELVVIGVYAQVQPDGSDMDAPINFTLSALRLPDEVEGAPESCARYAPLYDPLSDDVWSAQGEVEVVECDEGCVRGTTGKWYFTAPADGEYVFEVSRQAGVDLPREVNLGVHVVSMCGDVDRWAQNIPEGQVERQMRAGEVVGLTVRSGVYVGFYELSFEPMRYRLTATLQP